MSKLYRNNGWLYERMGRCTENGLPEPCEMQAMYAQPATGKTEQGAAYTAADNAILY